MIILTSALFVINMFKNNNTKEKEYDKEEEKNIIEYKANEVIRVKMHETNEIIAMDINDYLRGVLPAEMSPKYDLEALRAQAIVARTYTYKKMMEHTEGEDADICDNYAHCQAFYNKDKIYDIWQKKGYTRGEILEFWDKINQAIVSTQNKIITYNGHIINAYFHASSPEGTEDVSQIWGKESCPYLIHVESIEDESYENRTSQVIISYGEFANIINCDNSIDGYITEKDANNICINEYTTTGRVLNIRIKNIVIPAEKLRTMIGLKSTRFSIETNNEKNQILFNVIGYGHGVGMSQYGANGMAKKGYNYEEILSHYYKNTKIKKINKKDV